MQESQALIERVRRLNKDFQQLDLAIEPKLNGIRPGQSILVKVRPQWHPYLREQWWPVSAGDDRLVVERPAEMIYEPGQAVNVLGPVGEPFRFRRSLRHVLLMAYDTAPTPLVTMIPSVLLHPADVTLVLLGSAAQYRTEHLPKEVEIVHGDASLNWPDRVKTVGFADQVFAVVNPDDEFARFGKIWQLFSQLRAHIDKNYLFGVFRPLQLCGAGACQACLIPIKGHSPQMACTDGPAFDLSQISF
jgi:hypothetical protein